jgi:hypothetical protein
MDAGAPTSLSGRIGEIKQQGAVEAARDPNSKVTAEDAEHSVINEARKSGAPAFEFDPNASAAEKAAQVNSVCTFVGTIILQLGADDEAFSIYHPA